MAILLNKYTLYLANTVTYRCYIYHFFGTTVHIFAVFTHFSHFHYFLTMLQNNIVEDILCMMVYIFPIIVHGGGGRLLYCVYFPFKNSIYNVYTIWLKPL